MRQFQRLAELYWHFSKKCASAGIDKQLYYYELTCRVTTLQFANLKRELERK